MKVFRRVQTITTETDRYYSDRGELLHSATPRMVHRSLSDRAELTPEEIFEEGFADDAHNSRV